MPLLGLRSPSWGAAARIAESAGSPRSDPAPILLCHQGAIGICPPLRSVAGLFRGFPGIISNPIEVYEEMAICWKGVRDL